MFQCRVLLSASSSALSAHLPSSSLVSSSSFLSGIARSSPPMWLLLFLVIEADDAQVLPPYVQYLYYNIIKIAQFDFLSVSRA